MSLGTKEPVKQILESLEKSNVSTVVLDGKRGVGKTWTAREIVKNKDSIHDTLWLYLNNNYDTKSFHINLARQLSLFSIHEEWEDDDDVEEEQSSEKLMPRVLEKLKEFKSAAHEVKKLFLLVLDDVPHKQDVQEIVQELKELLSPNEHNYFKVLITRGQSNDEDNAPEMNQDIAVQQIEPLSTDESLAFFKKEIKNEVPAPSFDKLSNAIVEMSEGIPIKLITIAKAINYLLAEKGSGAWSMENVLEEAEGGSAKTAINLLLRAWCNALPSGAPTDCFWHTMQLLNKHGGVHYKELITQWIMEGYFGCNNQIGKAYEQGHKILMDLIEWGLLRKQENNMVVMGGINLIITGNCRREFNATARLGLANVFEDEKCWIGLGMLAHTDRMIKSPSSHKNWDKVSTLVMDGHCVDREVHVTCFERMHTLQA